MDREVRPLISSDAETIETRVKAHKPADSGAAVGNGARICRSQEGTLNTIKQRHRISTQSLWGRACSGQPMSGNAPCFLHMVQHKNGTRSVPGCIPTRSVRNDQWAAGRHWSASGSPSLAGQLPQGFVYICRRLVGCQAAIVGTPPGAARSHRGWVHNLKKMVDCLHLPLLTRRKGGSYVRGEKTGMDTRPDRSPPAHSRHNALTGSEQAGGDYACTDTG
jgi:hypothetical protein